MTRSDAVLRWTVGAKPRLGSLCALAPFVDEPGAPMLYSNGNSHLLSAILTRASRRSTLQLALESLGPPLGITIPAWQRDPQGIYLGCNEMALSPRAMRRSWDWT